MARTTTAAAAALIVTAALTGCRGGISESPPIHLVHDMDFQPKLEAQERSGFAGWKDRRAMRAPPAHTVARGSLPTELDRFKTADGGYVTDNPLARTMAVVRRGRERFEITCAVCHGRTGAGGIVARRWPIPVPDIARPSSTQTPPDRILKHPDGKLFEIISNGQGTMPGYAHQIEPRDRWAIVHYLRALQTHFQ